MPCVCDDLIDFGLRRLSAEFSLGLIARSHELNRVTRASRCDFYPDRDTSHSFDSIDNLPVGGTGTRSDLSINHTFRFQKGA